MNRRELLQGALVVALCATHSHISSELFESVPDNKIIDYLKRVRLDLANQIANPPCIMDEDGSITVMSTEVQQDALRLITKTLEELGT